MFGAFLLISAIGLGKEITSPTMPVELIIVGCVGISIYLLYFILMLAAARAMRKGKPWGEKFLKLFMIGKM